MSIPLVQQPESKAERAIALARETFDIEAAAVLGLKHRVGPSFARAVELVLAIQGRVVVMGMGKSGHIGRKIAATLRCLCIPLKQAMVTSA
jgi:arabinose-5-phosphate isomerase